MKVKTLLIIGISVMTVTAGGLIIASALKSGKKDNGDGDGDDNGGIGGSQNSGNSSVSGGGSSYKNESFPLAKGMKGENVKKLQTALGVTADGMFGNNTETALYAKYKVKTCNQTMFDSISKTNKDSAYTKSETSSAEPSQKIKELAVKLYYAIYGLGTNTSTVKEVFSSIKTQSDLNALINYWSKVANATKNKTLKGDLWDDMGEKDMEKYVNKPLRDNGINYQF